jgi:hypothetical protein
MSNDGLNALQKKYLRIKLQLSASFLTMEQRRLLAEDLLRITAQLQRIQPEDESMIELRGQNLKT